MSKSELLEAYAAGLIGRRDFIHGLITLGASASVAATYAVALRPATEASAANYYPRETIVGLLKAANDAARSRRRGN